MRKKCCIAICALVILCLFSSFTQAHTYKISVLVDTDMALDDMRALAMLLNSDMASIPLIVTSDGASSPQAGCRNLTTLLKYFKREGTIIAKGKVLGKPTPPWRPWSEKVRWPESHGASSKIAFFSPAPEAVVSALKSSDEGMLYLCLGPLSNLAEALELSPGIREKITRIIYYGGHPDDPNPGWNTSRDPEAARYVFSSGLDIYSMSLVKGKLLHFDDELFSQIKGIETAAARLVAGIHQDTVVMRLLSEGHFYVWDEMPVIFLNQPSLFKFVPSTHEHVMSLATYKAADVYNAYLKLLSYSGDFHLSARHSVVLKAFPIKPSLFKEDVIPYIEDAIEKYGLEEWKACLLTNELHRHLGIYSLIGAKMGIRAREILEAPFDTLEVVSLAGNSPPLSCMNDGLQVSTGASLGRGIIRVSNGQPRPAAIFLHHDQKATLSIKKKVEDKIKTDIKAALKEYGGLTPEYFAHIRRLSLGYWLDLDRREIFDELRGLSTSEETLEKQPK